MSALMEPPDEAILPLRRKKKKEESKRVTLDTVAQWRHKFANAYVPGKEEEVVKEEVEEEESWKEKQRRVQAELRQKKEQQQQQEKQRRFKFKEAKMKRDINWKFGHDHKELGRGTVMGMGSIFKHKQSTRTAGHFVARPFWDRSTEGSSLALPSIGSAPQLGMGRLSEMQQNFDARFPSELVHALDCEKKNQPRKLETEDREDRFDSAAAAEDLGVDPKDMEEWLKEHSERDPRHPIPKFWGRSAHGTPYRESRRRAAQQRWDMLRRHFVGTDLQRVLLQERVKAKKENAKARKHALKYGKPADRYPAAQARRARQSEVHKDHFHGDIEHSRHHNGIIPDGEGCGRPWGKTNKHHAKTAHMLDLEHTHRNKLLSHAKTCQTRLDALEEAILATKRSLNPADSALNGATVELRLAEHDEQVMQLRVDEMVEEREREIREQAQMKESKLARRKDKEDAFIELQQQPFWTQAVKRIEYLASRIEACENKVVRLYHARQQREVDVLQARGLLDKTHATLRSQLEQRKQLLTQIHSYSEAAHDILPPGMRIRNPAHLKCSRQNYGGYIKEIFGAYGSDGSEGATTAVMAMLTMAGTDRGKGSRSSSSKSSSSSSTSSSSSSSDRRSRAADKQRRWREREQQEQREADAHASGKALRLDHRVARDRWLVRQVFKAWGQATYDANVRHLRESERTRVQLVCMLSSGHTVGLSLSPQATGLDVKQAVCKHRGYAWQEGISQNKIVLVYEDEIFEDGTTLEDVDFISNSVLTVDITVAPMVVELN